MQALSLTKNFIGLKHNYVKYTFAIRAGLVGG